jgi:Zn-dependent protease with chaperone function
MATDFFQQQDTARRKTGLLVLYFGLALLALIGLTYLVCVAVFHYLPVFTSPKTAQAAKTLSLWQPALFLLVAAGVALVVGGGSLLKIAELAGGGKPVALMLGGREVPITTTDLRERRLLNIVEEMAIASGVPVPPVFVLPEETGINAFAAGYSPGDAVVAVSQGCLTYLRRDELQGVVAHEFSHILNGDMRLNIRLLGVIFGVMALSTIGWVLMEVALRSRSSSKKDNGRVALLLLGVGLYILGVGGAFFGWLIQAAVSRQREYLADASAVQFTRNPDGIGGALKKIGGLEKGSRIANAKAGEVSHMFIADAFLGRRLTALLATHPPLDDRIKRLDPQFDGKYPEVRPVGVSKEERRGPAPGRLPPIIPGMPQFPLPVLGVAPEAAAAHVGTVTSQEVTYAGALHDHLPEPLLAAYQEPFSARALIYCLLLDPRPAIREPQLALLRAEAEPRDYQETLRLAEPVRTLADATRLPLVDLAMPALRQMSPGQHQSFRTQVEALIAADQNLSLFEYALRCVLSRHLDAAFNRQRPHVRHRSPGKLAPQVAAVLSLLAWEGQPEEAKARAAFAAGMRTYLSGAESVFQLVPREQCSLPAFDQALRTLGEALPRIKRQVVVSCAACILEDRQVTVREVELLRATCAMLGCPMPPLVIEPEPV